MKSINLTKEKFTLVDDSDFHYLNMFKWCYAIRGGALKAKGGREYMHRLILGAKKGQIVDHIDGDNLNNQRHNLRFANKSQNAANRGLDKNNTSGYKGVSLDKRYGTYRAYIAVSGKYLHLGTFATKQEAAAAYNAAAVLYFKEFAWLNKI